MQQKETNCCIYRYWLIMELFLAIMILTGCAASELNTPESEIAASNTSPTLTVTATVTIASISPSATPSPSVTATPLPTGTTATSSTATPTISPTPVPTLTPLPTFEPQQRGQAYNDLMSNNGGCILPCWWGFEMGTTTLDEVRQFYTSLGTHISKQIVTKSISILDSTFVDPQIDNGIQVRHSFVAQDNVINEAEIQINNQPNYQIEPILQQLGQPSEVWMWTIPDFYEGILPSDFLLFFPERGVLAGYRTNAVKIDDAVNICFDESGATSLLLWDPTGWDPTCNRGIVERTNEASRAFTLEGYHPIEEVSNWDTEQFYTVLTDPIRSKCLETPSNLWPPP